MDLNSFLFPAPKSSYSADKLHGELIWIPKKPKPCEDEGNEAMIRQHTAPELGSDPLREITFHAKLLNLKNLVTVADSKFKPKGVDPEMDDISMITSETSKKPCLGGDMDFIEGLQVSVSNKNLIQLAFIENQNPANLPDDFPQEIPSTKRLYTDRTEVMNYSLLVEEPKSNLLPDYYIRSPKRSILEQDSQKFSFNSQLPPQKVPEKLDTVEKLPSQKKARSRRDFSMTSFDFLKISEGVDLQAIPLSTPKSMHSCSSTLQFRASNTPKNQTEITSPTINERKKANQDNNNLIECDVEVTNREETEDQSPGSPKLKGSLAKEPSEFRTNFSNRLNTEAADCTVRIKLEELKAPGYNKFVKLKTQVENMTSESYIPCMLLRSITSSSKIMIYFHGNGEDINLAYELLSHARNNLNVNVLAVEYPGYGLYEGKPSEATILEDSEHVYDYLVKFLKVNPRDIIIFGRSIGSGPATHLASRKNVGALILMSAFTSIRSLVRDLAGSLAQVLIKERFNNLQTIPKVSAPIFLIHGQKDRLISYRHSEQLHDACSVPCELLLPKNMDHIEFDFDEHFALPLIQFLGRCGINVGTWSNSGRIFFPKKLFELPDILKNKNKQATPKQSVTTQENKKQLIQPFSTISDIKHLASVSEACS